MRILYLLSRFPLPSTTGTGNLAVEKGGVVEMKKLFAFALCVLLPVVSSQASNIIWVSFHSADDAPSLDAANAGFTMAPDVGYTDLLAANGHTVTRYVTTGTPDVNFLNSADLVIISRSVPSGDYETDSETAAWNGITAPTMVLSGYLIRANRMGYTTGSGIPDTVGDVVLTVTDPSHPIFAGLTLNPDNTMTTPFAQQVTFNTVLQSGISVNTNSLAAGGTLLATTLVGTPAVAGTIIGEWQAGAVMNTNPADILGGHRMVFLTGSRENTITSQGAGIYDLTPAGAALFLNAVNYMAIPEPGTAALLAFGVLGALIARRRRT
jgi:hypothetical protein